MKKMTIRKMLERIVVATNKRRAKNMAQAQIEANKRFRKKSYDRIEITVPKGDREKIVQAASAAGMSVNAFIKEALVEYIARTTKQ